MRALIARFAPSLVVALVLTTPALAGPAAHQPLPDTQIRDAVSHALTDGGIAGVDVSVARGVVTLKGQVRSAWERQRAEEQAGKLPDVVEVVSDLQVARAESDQALAEAVSSRLRRYVLYSLFDDVGVQVQDGTVTLRGQVTMGYKAKDLGDQAARVPGVQAVRNEIATLPVSVGDDQLRVAVASAIYSDPVFSSYAFQLDPPVHVVVANGRVTLTGAVRSEVERVKAGFIAREVFGVLGVDNRLIVGK